MTYAERLGLSRAEFESLDESLDERSFEGHDYRHLSDARQGVERGTALFEGVVVRGYPKTPRVLVAETGIPQYFDGPVHVEEKLNGYNVRVVSVDGVDGVDGVLAFTRSGLVCPYTTRWLRRTVDLDGFFEAYPEAALCGEMLGPENPYTDHEYPGVDGLAFRAFSVRERASGDPMPPAERRDVLDEHGVPQAPHLGTYAPAAAPTAVLSHVRDLDEADREGVVMKSEDGRDLLKYTTSAANQGDLAYAFSLPFDYGRDFVFRRVVREGFQAVEFEEDDETLAERAHSLGEAILEPMVETIRQVQDGEDAAERHTVRGTDAEVDELLAHLRDQGLHLDVVDDREDDDGLRVVTFRKIARATTDKTTAYLDGHVVRE